METSSLHDRVLVCVDAEGVAAEAVIRGHELSRRFGSKVECLHVAEFPRTIWLGLDREQQQDVHEAFLASARQKTIRDMGRALREHGHLRADLEGRLRVVEGHPSRAILDRAEESQATLIVLGPHRKRGPLDLGSTLRAVLSHSPTPVWVQVGFAEPVNRILVGIDLSEHSAHTLRVASQLAASLDVHLTALHCFAESELYANPGAMVGPTYVLDRERDFAHLELERLVAEHARDARVQTEFCEGDSITEIRARSEDFDLVVVGARGRTGLSRFLLGSVAHHALKDSPVPVLVVPDHGLVGQLDGAPAGAAHERPATAMGSLVQPFPL